MWSTLTNGVRISGAVPEKADNRIGYVKYGEVGLQNAVRIMRAADSDGDISFTYRETFSWDQGVDALVEFMMDDLTKALAARYPRVPALERGEAVGFARARVWTAVEEGLLSGDADEDQMLWAVVRSTRDQFLKILRVQYPDEGSKSLGDLLARSLVANDAQLGAFLEEEFPGLNIALNSEIIFRLNMPGRVTDSNAHKRDGTTLIWEFGPAEALQTPIEIYAESVVGGYPAGEELSAASPVMTPPALPPPDPPGWLAGPEGRPPPGRPPGGMGASFLPHRTVHLPSLRIPKP